MTDEPTPWCCRGRAQSCPLCPDYGSRKLDPCPGHDDTPANQQTVATAALHARQAHPGWEYAATEGPRKQWDYSDEPPSDDNGVPDLTWRRNIDAGYPGEGWERFDYTEESYWRRPRAEVAEPDPVEPDNPAATALAQHIVDHSISAIQAAFRLLGMQIDFELHEITEGPK